MLSIWSMTAEDPQHPDDAVRWRSRRLQPGHRDQGLMESGRAYRAADAASQPVPACGSQLARHLPDPAGTHSTHGRPETAEGSAQPGTARKACLPNSARKPRTSPSTAWSAPFASADNPGWLRYFIRSDQRSPAAGTDARSFLLHIGAQFAPMHPELFTAEQVTVEVKQRIGAVDPDGSVVGVEVERTATTPRWCAGRSSSATTSGRPSSPRAWKAPRMSPRCKRWGVTSRRDTTMPGRCPPRTWQDGSAAGI